MTSDATPKSRPPVVGLPEDSLRVRLGSKIVPRWRRNVFARKLVSIFALQIADYHWKYKRRRGFCEVEEIDLEALAACRDENIEPLRANLEKWVGRGDLLFFAIKDGVVLGLIDLMRVDFRDREGLYMPIGEGEAKMRDIQVFPAYRRTPALGVIHEVALETAIERGIHTIYGAVAMGKKVENEKTRGGHKALRSSKHLGYKEVRRTVCYRLFRVFSWWRDQWVAPSLDEAREMKW